MNKQKGFTLIELLVVIAILGIIAAVVVLNIGNFFGRGTLQAANTELHQAETAIIAAVADCEGGELQSHGWWTGNNNTIIASCDIDASDYIYGSFRAAYYIDSYGNIITATVNSSVCAPLVITDPWQGIVWNEDNRSWEN